MVYVVLIGLDDAETISSVANAENEGHVLSILNKYGIINQKPSEDNFSGFVSEKRITFVLFP